jgi:MSHA biogenesis protein MshO
MSMPGELTARHRTSGFTLIEMVVTIVIIGILGVGISSFIGNTTKGMIDTAERSQVATIAFLVSERVSRSLRQALPNSIRTNGGSCIEYIPIYAGTDYLSVPISVTANQFEVAPFSNISNGFDFSVDPLRVAVYPISATGLYTSSVLSPEISQISAGATTGAQLIVLDATHQFPQDSPTRRLFLINEPNMYCFDSGLLYHYSAYGYQAALPTLNLNNQTVVGSRLGQGEFNYSPSTLKRNGVVTINFNVLGDDGLIQAVNQEVQIRNVP